MEELDIKRGVYSTIEGEKLGKLMEDIFGNVVKENEWYISRFGAMQPIKAMTKSKAILMIEIDTVSVPDEEVLDTFRKRNLFLEKATGFNSKQRLKRLKNRAKKGEM